MVHEEGEDPLVGLVGVHLADARDGGVRARPLVPRLVHLHDLHGAVPGAGLVEQEGEVVMRHGDPTHELLVDSRCTIGYRRHHIILDHMGIQA